MLYNTYCCLSETVLALKDTQFYSSSKSQLRSRFKYDESELSQSAVDNAYQPVASNSKSDNTSTASFMPPTNKSDNQADSLPNDKEFVGHEAISEIHSCNTTVQAPSSRTEQPYLINNFNGLETKILASPTIEVHNSAFNLNQHVSSNSVTSNQQINEHDFSRQEVSNTNDLFQIPDDKDTVKNSGCNRKKLPTYAQQIVVPVNQNSITSFNSHSLSVVETTDIGTPKTLFIPEIDATHSSVTNQTVVNEPQNLLENENERYGLPQNWKINNDEFNPRVNCLQNIETDEKSGDGSLDSDFHVNMNYTITYN